MKRIVTIMAIGLAPLFAASAQSDVDFAARIGGNQYYGTARTLGMGNAVTAVGGDLGSIGINPAGSAVFNYGQVEFSPGLSFANSAIRFSLPSAGFSFCFNTGRSSGLRNITFAFANNVSNNYLENFAGENLVDGTSFFGNLAAAANGIPVSDLTAASPYDNPDLDWALVSAWRAYMLGDVPDVDRAYIGGNEMLSRDGEGNSYHYVPGTLRQRSEVKRLGTKNDMVLNLGFNISDKFYFGFNLGIPVVRYQYREVYKESALDPEQFPIGFKKADGSDFVANFSNAQYGYSYSSTSVGVYGKVGVLWRPLNFLRVGAAIQTPTVYSISEGYSNSVSSLFTGAEGNIRGSASSPDGSYDYKFRGPWCFNTGVAFTIGEWALLSADYEMTAYGKTRYSEKSAWNGEDYFKASNEALARLLGNAHALRLGAEVRPLPGFSVRAGYTLTGTPERVQPKFGWSASFGAGWSSSGSFFVDAAVRYNGFPTYTYYPYLYGDYAAVDKDNRPLEDASSPRLNVNRKLWDLVVTLGWRF